MSLDGVTFCNPFMLRCEQSEPRGIRQDRVRLLQQTPSRPGFAGHLRLRVVGRAKLNML